MLPSSYDGPVSGVMATNAASVDRKEPENIQELCAVIAGCQKEISASDVQPNDSVVPISRQSEAGSTVAPRVQHGDNPAGAKSKIRKTGRKAGKKKTFNATPVVTIGVSQTGTPPAQFGALSQLAGASFCATPIDAATPVFVPTMKGSSRKQTPSERLQRSRERNRMHARKTRQRKKEHVQTLQNRADELKQEQIRLRQLVNEKNTANILVGLFSQGNAKTTEDPRIEELLRRPAEEIPDASKIPELPALILPGQHNSKKNKAVSNLSTPSAAKDSKTAFPDDGIDYDLLGKDRSQCSPEELDQIRRERNRMHAKRTRDRKRLFIEEMEEMIKKLECENKLLKEHADKLNVDQGVVSVTTTPSLASPCIKPSTPSLLELPPTAAESSPDSVEKRPGEDKKQQQTAEVEKIKSLLAAAGAFDNSSQQCKGMLTISSVASVVSTTHSAAGSVSDDLSHGSSSPRPVKRQRHEANPSAPRIVSAVPNSITTVGV